MSDQSAHSDEDPSPRTDQHDQLRTIAFRMREIQRLLAMRIEQENRRLEEEGIDRVTEFGFREKNADE